MFNENLASQILHSILYELILSIIPDNSCLLVKSLFHVVFGIKRLLIMLQLRNMNSFILEKNLMLVAIILEKNLMLVASVCEKKFRQKNSLKRREKNLLLVVFVIKNLWNIFRLSNMKCFTLEKNLMLVLFVSKKIRQENTLKDMKRTFCL